VADVPGLERVRFTSPHPKDFPPALLDAIAGHPNICKHIHLPLQSGNDRILGLMNRTYTVREYLALVEAVRRRHHGIALSTDIICGFCSETEAEFMDTYRIVENVGFHMAYVFTYSERKNTIAARKHADDVPRPIKSERVSRVVDLQKTVSARLNSRIVGSTVDVMVEGDSKRSTDQWMGKADSSVTVVWNKLGDRLSPGDIVPVAIHGSTATTLFGPFS
jgi:tRNA-2-methylthio-N6-dimethylallyladenosine synthase